MAFIFINNITHNREETNIFFQNKKVEYKYKFKNFNENELKAWLVSEIESIKVVLKNPISDFHTFVNIVNKQIGNDCKLMYFTSKAEKIYLLQAEIIEEYKGLLKYFESEIKNRKINMSVQVSITVLDDGSEVEVNKVDKYKDFGYFQNGVLHWSEKANQLAYSLYKIEDKLGLDSITPNSILKFIDNSKKIQYTCSRSTIIKRLEELQANREQFDPKAFVVTASQVILNLLKAN